MRQSLSVMAAATAVVAVAASSSSSSNSNSSPLDSRESQQQQQQRVLDGWYGAPSWGLEPESDSGKSGKGSGKSGKSSDDDDGWNSGWEHGHGSWGIPPPPPYPPAWWSAEHEHSESGKSGKSKSSKGGDDGGSWVLVPPSGGWEEDGWSVPESDSGKSGKGSSGKSGKGEEEEDDDGALEGSSWSGPWGPPPPHPPFESTGKSGKSKSSKGSSDEEGWFGPWGPSPPHGWYPSESEGKSGKAKSGKSGDGEWVLLPPPPSWDDDDGWSGPEEEESSGKSGKSSGSSGSGKSGKGEEPEPEPEPSWSPPPKVEEEVEEEHTALNAICFEKGERVDCSAWGDDGYGDDEGAVSVAFTYTVDTDGEVDPESTIGSMENAILEDVASHVEENDKYASFSGKISAAPGDGIADDDWCGDGHAVRCTVVKGEMSVSPSWSGDGHAAAGALDECSACEIVKDSMEGHDYTDIDGVTGAKYRNCDAECDSGTVIAGAATVVPPQDEDLSGGALFAIWLAALAAIALLALLLARKRRRNAQEVNDDMSLISNDLNGNHFGDYEDPYANTIDVHKCTSIYCNCNSKLNETTFLPAPKTVDMARMRSDNGLSPPGAAVNQLSNEEEEPLRDDAANEVEHKGSIMRMPFAYQSEETTDRPLTPVNEIAHDSEIDTELESVADDDTNIPPPPPIAFHPSYNKQSSDEISI